VNVLLLVDLEGVTGVDSIGDLLEGQPRFEGARALLAAEIVAACDGLRRGRAAADRIVIADSHRGGPGPTVDVGQLPAGVRLHRGPDDYPPALFDDVQAVAGLGMHAGNRGFAPHTLDLACVWESEGRPVSESDLFLGVAAARGVPAVFLSGDDAVDARGLPFVATKTAVSPVAARSRPMLEVLGEIRRAAGAAPVPAPALSGPLAIRFRSRWMAERAEQLGFRRIDETAIALPPGDLPTTLAAGRALMARALAPLGEAFRPWALPEDATALAARGFDRALPASRQGEARRALRAFLARTDRRAAGGHGGGADWAGDGWCRANRALTLHMLAGHAPAFFAAESLAGELGRAIDALAGVSAEFSAELDEQEAMARLDALYVRHLHGQPVAIDATAFAGCAAACAARNPIYGWLLAELATQMGAAVVPPLPARAFRRSHRLADLIALTHLYFLETRYLRDPLPATGWETQTEELMLSAPELLADSQLDLAAEVAVCLVAAGEQRAPERARILDALVAHQRADGSVIEPRPPDPEPRQRFRDDTHCTAAALLALATAT
jgi:D-amino peptidase